MNIESYINSGIIELYVLGALSDEESREVIRLATVYPEINNEIERISATLEFYSQSSGKTPSDKVKPMLMATLDYMQRLENGETPVIAPPLSKHTKADDFSEWLNHPNMQAPSTFDKAFVKIISFTPQLSTAIVWLKEGSPEEIHTKEYESFFILEGTCDIRVNDDTYQLYPGDVFTIPLHALHSVKVTSEIACKLILERKAA
jgi:mannose-6-phosphate isomerase-like protein (cupin superfamily)